MNILRRNPPDGNDKAEKPVAEQAGAQRIEVTVEQEWVSMLVRGQPKTSAEAPPGEEPARASPPPKLPPPAEDKASG
jgi:hypothetical protein